MMDDKNDLGVPKSLLFAVAFASQMMFLLEWCARNGRTLDANAVEDWMAEEYEMESRRKIPPPAGTA